MKRIFTTLFLFMFMVTFAFTQGKVTGTILDAETDEPLIGASVLIAGTTTGTVTDYDGSFTIENLDAGDYNLVISYTGYTTMEMAASVTSGSETDLGKLMVESGIIGLDEVKVIASLAVDRKTPVAVSTIKGETIEAMVGNQEYPEILRNTPSIYVTKSGGGFGDARINVRGFDQRNTAVMINGIPVNDMENGWVYWSNWAGLSDVTSSMQVQRGLGASKLAVPSVGGSINIVTNAADFEQGGKVSIGLGNDGYQKYGVMLSSGLGESGFAATAQFTHTRGDGYIDATAFRAYSYFLSLSQTFGDNHTLAFTALGAPQWHHQRSTSRFDRVYLDTYVDNDGDLTNTSDRGIKFNHVAGTLDGEEFTWRRNFYHKPKAFINHYWNINDKTDLKTSAYVSLGRGGGTGPRGRLRTPGSVFDSFSGFDRNTHDASGAVRFDDIVSYNQGRAVDGWGDAKSPENNQLLVTADGRFYFDDGSRNSNGSGFIRRASMNYHDWYGVLSTLTTELSDNLTLVAGVDGRYYKGEHFRRLENLLGAQGYVSRSNDNNPYNVITEVSPATFGNFSDNSFDNGDENRLAYHNDGLVSWIGLFGQMEYSLDNASVFVSVSGSNQGFKRIDYFNYLDSDPEQTTDWQNFLGGTIKAGLNLNIDDNNNIFVNAGYLSKQPIFDNVFLNFQNDINENIENQNIIAAEAGYGYRGNGFKVNLNGYYTVWDNRQFDEGLDALARTSAGDTLEVDALVNYFGVQETHVGGELELAYSPSRNFTINLMGSVGNWTYSDQFSGNVANLDSDDPIISLPAELVVEADGIKVGDAAQTTFSIGANYKPIDGLSVYADWYLADNLYAEFDILDDQFLAPGGEVVKLPSYNLLNGGASYTFDLGKTSATVRVNVNNILDEIYIAELDTNVVDDPTTPEVNEFYTRNQGFYGFGRTWNAGVKFSF